MATYNEFEERKEELESRFRQLHEDTFGLIEDLMYKTEETEFTNNFFDTI